MVAQWDEFGLIAKLFRPLAASEPGAFDLRDDAAVLQPTPGHDWVISADALVAGVHFFSDDPADAIAQKVLRVNLSDLAAMGARPRAAFLTCAFPKTLDQAWLDAFAAGLSEDLDRFGVSLAGGDVVSTPGPLTLSVTIMGETPSGRVLRRNGVKPGDVIAVTGCIGDAALGLDLMNGRAPGSLKEDDRTYLKHRYRYPQPRINVGYIFNGVANAGMDISDGLLGDLQHMAQASSCDIAIDTSRVPLSPAAQNWLADKPDDLERVLCGGDDYELVIACSPEDYQNLARALENASLPFTVIGRAEVGQGEVFRIDDGQRKLVGGRAGHQHGV
jgi:thiamine-monophosphate kinase